MSADLNTHLLQPGSRQKKMSSPVSTPTIARTSTRSSSTNPASGINGDPPRGTSPHHQHYGTTNGSPSTASEPPPLRSSTLSPRANQVPVESVDDLSCQSYPTVAGSPTASSFLLMALVNRMSGERSAADTVYRSFVARFGTARVVELTIDVFKDPSAVIKRIVQLNNAFHAAFVRAQQPPGQRSTTPRQKSPRTPRSPQPPIDSPTRKELSSNAFMKRTGGRASVFVAGGDGTVAFVMDLLDKAFPSSGAEMNIASGPLKPAVGILPLGTGNDLSDSLGSGLGFTENACCVCCVCCPNSVERLVTDTLLAPIQILDRWHATVSQLPRSMIATEYFSELANQQQQVNNTSGSEADAPDTFTPAAPAPAAELKKTPSSSLDDPRRPVTTMLDSEHELFSTNFSNYLSFGMDACISDKFDRWRKKLPSLHRLRSINKGWYAIHGLCAALTVDKINSKNTQVVVDGHLVPLSKSSEGAKACVISNASSYGGGVHLWNVADKESIAPPLSVPIFPSDHTYSTPTNKSSKSTHASTTTTRTFTPVQLDDGKVEITTVGGAVHMAALQLSHGNCNCCGADRVSQGNEIDIFLGDFTPPEKKKKKKKEELCEYFMQTDGEPKGCWKAPIHIRIRQLDPSNPSYVHKQQPCYSCCMNVTKLLFT